MPEPHPVFLHIGAPKTGTTYLQTLMQEGHRELAAAGLCVPGRRGNHQPATREFRKSRRISALVAGGTGLWEELVAQVNAWPGPAVVSNETFGARLTPRHIKQLTKDFSGRTLHVVLTVRDLQRQLPAAWQEAVKNGSVLGLAQYVDLVAGPDGADHPAERRLWAAQDAMAVLAKWAGVVPDDHVHVVTVPPSGADRTLLWRRFAGVVGVDAAAVDAGRTRPNVSLGAVETNVLRRVNQRLESSPTPPSGSQYLSWVKGPIANGVLQSPGPRRPIHLTAQQAAWAVAESCRVADELGRSGYHVVGDLDDLRPEPSGGGDGYLDPDRPDAADERDAAVATLVGMVLARAKRAPAPPDAG